MIRNWRVPAAVSLLVLTAGCSQTGKGPEDPVRAVGQQPLPADWGETGPVRSKPDYESARKLADSVKVGMPQQQVEAMFGAPDKAGYKVYGRATQKPWRALVWEWVFQDIKPPRALSIVFQEDGSGMWRVNHGDWPD